MQREIERDSIGVVVYLLMPRLGLWHCVWKRRLSVAEHRATADSTQSCLCLRDRWHVSTSASSLSLCAQPNPACVIFSFTGRLPLLHKLPPLPTKWYFSPLPHQSHLTPLCSQFCEAERGGWLSFPPSPSCMAVSLCAAYRLGRGQVAASRFHSAQVTEDKMSPIYALMAANSSDFISRHAAQNAAKPVLKVCLVLL